MTAKDFINIKTDLVIDGLRTDGVNDFVHIGLKEISIPSKYNPINDIPDEYMEEKQLAFFKKVLLNWRQFLLDKTIETINVLTEDSDSKRVSEDGDFAVEEERLLTELRTRDRYRKLIHKIEESLIRIETGEYGYCEESGEEIGIPRLLIRPTATLCLANQEKHELKENLEDMSKKTHDSLIEEEDISG